ncbi:hypothetical protein QA634_12770 [Methylobacterium sp. CB376]|uniref:hypothetical protein n=1 Tax=unclassified Methylobacterium TaxID=2615210 RepID=UPI001237840A|nr:MULTISPECIES: hypothetical protein [Methylobacterium]WFT82656.1 hypothetical protein QA634_12770 [Methylobacterium nodulans]
MRVSKDSFHSTEAHQVAKEQNAHLAEQIKDDDLDAVVGGALQVKFGSEATQNYKPGGFNGVYGLIYFINSIPR